MIEVLRDMVDQDVEAVHGRWFRSSVWLAYRVNPAEVRRRRDVSCGAITSIGILRTLAVLPVGVTVPRDWFCPDALRSIEAAPNGAVDAGIGGITRLLAPVTVPLLAVAEAPRWTVALDRAARFAPFCQRVIAVEDVPRDWDNLVFEAQLYGIGVLLRGELVVQPAPFVDGRYSPQRWQFAERVFRRHLEHGDVSAAKPPTV